MLWAPSQISSGCSLRCSRRPGSETADAGAASTGRPRKASAAATARARLLRAVTSTRAAPFSSASGSPFGLSEDDDAAGLDDRELLGRDRLACVAEDVRVVERDAREHDDLRAEDVRGVVAAAESRLDDGDVDPRVGEREQGRRGQGLELRGSQGRGPGSDPGGGAFEVGLLAADADPLAPAADVRGHVRADPEPGAGQERLRHPRRRRLAVRADDVDGRVAELRVAELGEQRTHALDPEAVRRPRAQRSDPLSRVHLAGNCRLGTRPGV